MNQYDRTGAAEDALRQVQPTGAPPPRDAMLTQAYLRATTKEDQMSVFDRLFSGRPLAAKFGIAGAMLLLLLAAAVLLPRPGFSPALAATEGVVLNYDMSAFSGEQAHKELQAKFKELERSFAAELPEGAQLKTNVTVEVRREKRVVKHDGVEQGSPQESETRKANLRVLLSGADDATLAKLRAAIAAAVPGIPEPKVEDATWFREHGEALDGGINITLNLNGDEHMFNFPKGTGAEQIKREIKAWVDQKHPGMDFNVDVNVSDDGADKKQVEIRIEGKGEAVD